MEVKVRAPYKQMLINGVPPEFVESVPDQPSKAQVTMRWQFSQDKASGAWLSDTLYMVPAEGSAQ